MSKVKLVRYTYKTDDQEWNTPDSLTTYQNAMYEAYKTNVLEPLKESLVWKEDSATYDGNVSTKVRYFDNVAIAMTYWSNINDMSNPYVKVYKDSISNSNPVANNFNQHEIETRIETLDGDIIVQLQPRH